MISVGSGANWVDLSSPAPAAHDGGLSHGAVLSWSPNAEMLLADTGTAGMEISRYDFGGGSLNATVLVPSSSLACGQILMRPWSPDGKNGVFACAGDLRGISNVATAKINSDFSVLPSGILSSMNYGDENWSPNSQWFAVRASGDLYLIRWSAPDVANKPYANTAGSGVVSWSFAQNSQSIAIVGTVSPQNDTGLYLSQLPISGAPLIATPVSAPAHAGVQADVKWLPGSRVLTYRAVVSGAPQLFALPVAADGTPGTPISISGVSGTGVTSYQLAPTR